MFVRKIFTPPKQQQKPKTCWRKCQEKGTHILLVEMAITIAILENGMDSPKSKIKI